MPLSLEPVQNSATMPNTINSFQSEAIKIYSGDLSKGIILMCEHATSTIPEPYKDLGLPSTQLNRHIAYDIGAEAVTRYISERLNIPAITTCYSRLLIDPNRALNDPTLIMQLSDGAVIPGNAYISATETKHRIDTYYQPYHEALKAMIDQAIETGTTPILMSIHSFTDRWKEIVRPWEISVLWDKDPRLPSILLKELAKLLPAHKLGDNEPYSGRLIRDSMYSHATLRGLSHSLIELRQDLIREVGGQEKWGNILSDILQNILDDPSTLKKLQTAQNFGTFTK